MLTFAFFISLSPLLVIAAPLSAHDRLTVADSNPRSTLYRRAPPTFEIPRRLVGKPYQKDTLDKMKKHYDIEATDEQKGAGLAIAASRWRKMPDGRQHLTFNYHAGDTTNSPVIGSGGIYREKPAPMMHFGDNQKSGKEDMTAEAMKRYKGLGDANASKVKSIKVWGDWDTKGGLREKTDITFHASRDPTALNMVGSPMTIKRPLTLKVDHVPLGDRKSVEEEIRSAHKEIMAHPQHRARESNYGTALSGWQDGLLDKNGKAHTHVVVAFDKVSKDESEQHHMGFYGIYKSSSGHESPGLNVGSSSAAGPSSGVPSRIGLNEDPNNQGKS